MFALLQPPTLQEEVSRGVNYWFSTRSDNWHHFAGNRYTDIPVAVEHNHAVPPPLEPVVYTARKIVTMDEDQPVATAVSIH